MDEPLLRDPESFTTNGSHNSSYHGFICLLTFKFVDPVLSIGAVRQLEFRDLLELPSQMESSVCYSRLCNYWESQIDTHPSLFKSICKAYGWEYVKLGLLKLLNDSIGFVGPLLLNKLIRFLQQGSHGLDGFIFAMGLGCVSVLKSFLDTQYTYHLSKLKLKLRSGIMVTIYQKCLSITLAERKRFSEGEIQTYMSVDVDRVVNLCNSVHDMWSLPLQISIALYMLYTQVRFAFIAGVAIIILLIPVNKWISNLIANATKEMMKQKDGRIGRTAELLTHIRTLKMYGWELLFTNLLMKLRSSEVKHLSTRKYLDAWCVFFWAATPTLFSLCTFGLFILTGNQLDAATVFTCLALFNILISPLNSFPWVINGLIDAFISTKRLSMFMGFSEHGSGMGNEDSNASISTQLLSECYENAVEIHGACCSWSIDGGKEEIVALDNVTLGIPKGSLVAIIGEVGCGKSSLLNAILGETLITDGSVISHGSKAYVPQVPWILSGTIRSNIVLGKTYDAQRYSTVLRVCALDVDISQLVAGDMTCVAEKGSNLSGGQKSRIALARAIYHGCDIFLLDDVLSAVDAHVASWILDNAILGPLMNQQTRILCTHSPQVISAADMIVIMDKGHVKWMGNSREFSKSSVHSSVEGRDDSAEIDSSRAALRVELSPSLEKDGVHVNESEKETIEEEQRVKGRVEISVYKKYSGFCGWFITVIICISAIAMQATRNGNDLWLSYWVDSVDSEREMNSTLSYLDILSAFCLMNSMLTLIRAFSFAYGGLRAAAMMHDRLIVKIVGAPVSFFDETPGGRILNRFSSDLYTIDDSLPFILNILLANSVGLLGIVAVLIYVQVTFLIALLPFWFLYSKLQFYYRSTSRELRRLDSVSRSPIYTSFTETLDGSSTIRALESQDYFSAKFDEQVALYSKTSFSEMSASLWLSLRLQLLGASIVSFVAVMAVVGSRGNIPVSLGTPGLVGLALSYAAPIVSLLGSFLTSFAETEKEMVSVERVMQYMNVPQEELHKKKSVESGTGWPSEGHIEFRNVTLRYKPSLPAALRDITFSIKGGNQVGVIGRTGAGKSSILNALFRLAPISEGLILVDGTNIADISLRDLRMHFAVVPQTPFLFEGSLRENLDPFLTNDDASIWNILKKCHMETKVASVGGLDIILKDPGTLFSIGQRQLICLARALLKSSKVLCLDECSANVDTETATILQNAISSECMGVTVITIAHRISTILKMDEVFILSGGCLVEQGNPQILLQDEYSIFSSFAKASSM
uniref:ABC-type xenobiotic transporter n=1 Tax=Sedum alfredii TaxID=439688 RepID=A0A856ZBP7_9MAGN|nr:ABCC transporter [Sedum alfredii]